MSTSSPSAPLQPLIAIIGTTGVGKSQLSVDLALSLSSLNNKAEIINSDSMQVYRSLDILTNKVTDEEKQGVPHHLLGFLEPGDEYMVGDFRKDALNKIEELKERNTLPIVVGGTSYYLQHLIFPNQLVADSPPSPTTSSSTPSIDSFPLSLRTSILSLPPTLLELFYLLPSLPSTSSPSSFPPSFPISSLPPEFRTPESLSSAFYKILSHVDPKSAERWHWRDVRKVRRALEIVWEGRRWEDVVEEQERRKGVGGSQSQFRTLIFWLYADKEVLEPRLDSRVDTMIERGLLTEISSLLSLSQAPPDPTLSIYQSIGFREFSTYLTSENFPNEKEFETAKELMKLSTRQYAKKQVGWIKKKLLPEVREREGGGEETKVFLLDATDLEKWNENVRDVAISIMKAWIHDERLPSPSSLSPLAASQLDVPAARTSADKAKRKCDLCSEGEDEKPFIVENWQWETHLKSKGHLGRKKKLEGGTRKDKWERERDLRVVGEREVE